MRVTATKRDGPQKRERIQRISPSRRPWRSILHRKRDVSERDTYQDVCCSHIKSHSRRAKSVYVLRGIEYLRYLRLISSSFRREHDCIFSGNTEQTYAHCIFGPTNIQYNFYRKLKRYKKIEIYMITAIEKRSIYLLALIIKLFMLYSVQDVYQRIYKTFNKDFGPFRP